MAIFQVRSTKVAMSNLRLLSGHSLAHWSAVLALLSTVISGCAVSGPKPVPDGVEPQTVHAALIEANTCLFRHGSCSAPALVVFSLDPEVPFSSLRQLAKLTYSTKGTVAQSDDLKVLATPFADETYRGDEFIRVPESLGYGHRTYIAPIWIERGKLTRGYLSARMAFRLDVYVVDGLPSTTRFLGVDPYTVDR